MRFQPMPSEGDARVHILCHRDDLPLLVDEDGQLAFTPAGRCELVCEPRPVDDDWFLILLDAVVRTEGLYAPTGVKGDDAPDPDDFRHVFLSEYCLSAPNGILALDGESVTSVCTCFGTPVAPFNSLLFTLSSASDYYGEDWEIVATNNLTAVRLLLDGKRMFFDVSPRLVADDLPIGAIKAVDKRYQEDGDYLLACYNGDTEAYDPEHYLAVRDFWGLVREEADRLSFV